MSGKNKGNKKSNDWIQNLKEQQKRSEEIINDAINGKYPGPENEMTDEEMEKAFNEEVEVDQDMKDLYDEIKQEDPNAIIDEKKESVKEILDNAEVDPEEKEIENLEKEVSKEQEQLKKDVKEEKIENPADELGLGVKEEIKPLLDIVNGISTQYPFLDEPGMENLKMEVEQAVQMLGNGIANDGVLDEKDCTEIVSILSIANEIKNAASKGSNTLKEKYKKNPESVTSAYMKNKGIAQKGKEMAQNQNVLIDFALNSDREVNKLSEQRAQQRSKQNAAKDAKTQRVVLNNLAKITISNSLKVDPKMRSVFSRLSNAGHNEMIKMYGQKSAEGISQDKIRGAIACSMISQIIAFEKKREGVSKTEQRFIANPNKVFLEYANSDAVRAQAEIIMKNPAKGIENYVVNHSKAIADLNIQKRKDDNERIRQQKENEKKVEEKQVEIKEPEIKQPEIKQPEIKEEKQPESIELKDMGEPKPEFEVSVNVPKENVEIVEDYIPVEKEKEPEVVVNVANDKVEIIEDYIPVEKEPEIKEEPKPEVKEAPKPRFDENAIKGAYMDNIEKLGPELTGGAIMSIAQISAMANGTTVNNINEIADGVSFLIAANIAQREGMNVNDFIKDGNVIDDGILKTARGLAAKLHNNPEACAEFLENSDKVLTEMGNSYMALHHNVSQKDPEVKEEPKPEVKEEPKPEVKEEVKEEPKKEEEVIQKEEEPIKEEKVVEEPVKEEKVVEEPKKEEEVIQKEEEPVKEEKVVEEPVKEEKVVEEPKKEEAKPTFNENEMKAAVIDKMAKLGPEVVAGCIQGLSLVGAMAGGTETKNFEDLCTGLSGMMVAKLAERNGLEVGDIVRGDDTISSIRALGLTNAVREMAEKLYNNPEACADFMANSDKYLDEMGDEYVGLNRDDLKKKMNQAEKKEAPKEIEENVAENQIEKLDMAKGVTNLMVDDMVRSDKTGKLGQIMEGPKGDKMFRACMLSQPVINLVEDLLTHPENMYSFFMEADSNIHALGENFQGYLTKRNSKDIKMIEDGKRLEAEEKKLSEESKKIETESKVQENIL